MSISQTATIDQTAIIRDGAVIGSDCQIGPYCLVGEHVRLEAGVTLKSHVVLEGHTEIGAGTTIWPFASIGHQPQDLKFDGEQSRLIIGANNMIRESVTMNPGTSGGGLVTRVGDNNLFMVNVHVGHDCQHSGIHQFVRIGQGAMVGVLSAVLADVIPYGTVTGDAAKLSGLNLVGLKRRNASKSEMNGLRASFKPLFSGEGTFKERATALKNQGLENSLVDDVLDFVLTDSDRSFCKPEL